MIFRNFTIGMMVALGLFFHTQAVGMPLWVSLLLVGATGVIAGVGTGYEQREAARVARLAQLKGEDTDGKA